MMTLEACVCGLESACVNLPLSLGNANFRLADSRSYRELLVTSRTDLKKASGIPDVLKFCSSAGFGDADLDDRDPSYILVPPVYISMPVSIFQEAPIAIR